MESKPLTEPQLVDLARSIRSQRDELEAALEKCRRRSRDVAIALIFEHQYSLARTCAITGHMRPTLRVWVEAEIAKRGDSGLTSPRVTETSTGPMPEAL